MAFRGTFEYTLDAKNRLTVPAKFRAAMSDGVVITRGSERCVEVWPAAVYEAQTESALSGLNPLSPEARELKRRLYAGAFDTELDSAGRVMLPAMLLEHGGLGKEISVIGAGEWLEAWDRGAWAEHDADTPTRINELTANLGHPA